MKQTRRYKIHNVPREQITAQMVRDRLDYDRETGVLRWKVSPCNNCPVGSIAGGKGCRGYVSVKLLHHPYQAHRLAWLIVHGTWPGIIDHIDGDKTNNALANLREATASQNQVNKPCRGYHYSSRVGRFGSSIRVNGEKVWLGYFDTAEAARSAYLAEHAKHHGEFSFTQRPAGGQAPKNASRLSTSSSPGAQ